MKEGKKLILYAIVPALIAGLFSIAPKLYEEVTKPKAVLEYRVTTGPSIQVQDGFQRIVSIATTNSGKKTIKNLTGELSYTTGKIETFEIQNESGLKPSVAHQSNTISVQVPTFHPGELFSITLLLNSPKPDGRPYFTVRSDETVGIPSKNENSKSQKSSSLLGSILSGLSVFIMSIAVILRLKKKGHVFGYTREDVIFYILIKLQLTELLNEVKLSKNPLTYLRFSDILLSYGLSDTGQNKQLAIKALKCLILVDGIANASKEIIIHNLKELEGEKYSEEEVAQLKKTAINTDETIELRQLITKYLE